MISRRSAYRIADAPLPRRTEYSKSVSFMLARKIQNRFANTAISLVEQCQPTAKLGQDVPQPRCCRDGRRGRQPAVQRDECRRNRHAYAPDGHAATEDRASISGGCFKRRSARVLWIRRGHTRT